MAEDNIIFQISDEKRRRQLFVKKIKLSNFRNYKKIILIFFIIEIFISTTNTKIIK